MKHKLFAFLCVICALCEKQIFAQNAKGLSVIEEKKPVVEGKTYALICGISKYKNPAIPSLQFADRDAVAFRNYLVASGVDSNNIILLLNEKATNGEFWSSLNFLTDLAKQGDKVYIYFSGHGDVENKTVVKDAYLLPYDAPKCVYPAGAIAVPLLKSWVATFSAAGIQAVFIADACRSGNLAGGREGMEAAASMLKDKWQDEIKILSCQPGELSLEGKQWGEGRGLFSYELINGMSGLADKNKDGKVSLLELNLYLMDKVPDEASPMPQNPMLFGNADATISKVNQKMLAEISSKQNNNVLAAIDTKGFDDAMVANLNDTIKENYRLFKVYLDSGKLVSDSNEASAHQFYNRLPVMESTKLLVSLAKRNLSAALQNQSQEIIDFVFSNDFNKRAKNWRIVGQKFVGASKKMSLALELIGQHSLSYNSMKARQLFLEALAILKSNKEDGLKEAQPRIDSAIALAPTAYIYWLKSQILYWSGDSVNEKLYLDKAIELAPKWTLPILNLSLIYISAHDYFNTEKLCSLAISIDSTESRAYAILHMVRLEQKDTVEALKLAQKEVFYNANDPRALTSLGEMYFTIKDFANAMQAYENSILVDDGYSGGYYGKAYLLSFKGDKKEALANLEKALSIGPAYPFDVHRDAQLDPIRQEPQFKALMKKYFPDKYKD